MDENKRFPWEAGASSPPHYPAEPAYVSFISADGSGGGTPSAPISDTNPWGEDGISSGGSGEPKLLPVKLDIKWLSYVENQFYTGSFNLPYDKILALFKAGYEEWNGIDSTDHIEYKTIIAGMAPGGLVVVWVVGVDGTSVEVAHYQATKTKMDLDAFSYHLADKLKLLGAYSKTGLGEDGLKYLAEHGMQLGRWNTFRERFNWRPVVRFDQPYPVEPNQLILTYVNGEQDFLFTKELELNPFKQRARLREIIIDWAIIDQTTKVKHGFWAPLEFDEDEILNAYKEVYGTDVNQQGELIVDIDRANRYYRCYLLAKGKKIELKKMQGVIETND